MRLDGFSFRFVILVFLLITATLLIPFGNTQNQKTITRNTILWFYPSIDTWITIEDFCSWCLNHSITVVAVFPDITTENRTYLQNYGIDVYRIFITAGEWNPPPVDNNYTKHMQEILYWADGYDGIVLDDTHNLWNYAHQSGVDDLVNYQAFLDYVDLFLVPEFGADNTIVEMCIFGDHQDITKCKQLNVSCTFSYYYPPSDTISYSGLYFNTNASSWNIRNWYDTYGLDSYYAYEGWLWFNSNYSVSSLLNTYEGITELSAHYDVNNLQIWNFERVYINSTISDTVGNICQAFLEDRSLEEGIPLNVLILTFFIITGISLAGIYIFRKLR